jgi:hypothetical protein
VAGSDDNSVRVCNLWSYGPTCVRKLKPSNKSSIQCVALDGKRVASVAQIDVVCVWPVFDTAVEPSALHGHMGSVQWKCV